MQAKRLRVVALLLVSAVCGICGAENSGLLFVEPVTTRQAGQTICGLIDIRTVRVVGGRVSVFVQADFAKNSFQQKVKTLLSSSSALREALRLRALSQNMAPAPAQKRLVDWRPLLVWVMAAGLQLRPVW